MSFRAIALFVIALSVAVVLSGCIPIDVQKSIALNRDGSGSMSTDISAPSSPLAQEAFQDVAGHIPSWANARLYNQEYAVHLDMQFNFRNPSDLNGKLSQLAEMLAYKEEIQFVPRDAGGLMKRGYFFRAYLSPQHSSNYDVPPDLTSRYFITMPGRVVYSNSPTSSVASWEIHGYKNSTLIAHSVESVPLYAELNLKLMPFGGKVDLDVMIADENLKLFPWAKRDWNEYKKLMKKKLNFMGCRNVTKSETFEREKVKLNGLRFSARFKDLASLVDKASLSSKTDDSRCQIKVTKKGLFRPIYTYDIVIPPTRGTSLEGILDGGTVKVKAPGRIVRANTPGRDSKDANVLQWDVSLAKPCSIKFVYMRTAWEVIIPVAAGCLILIVGTFGVLLRRRRKAKIRKLKAESADAEVEQDDS
jgi:hypothetical protein